MGRSRHQHGLGAAFINGLTTIAFLLSDPIASRLLVLDPILSNTLGCPAVGPESTSHAIITDLDRSTTQLQACQVPLSVRRCLHGGEKCTLPRLDSFEVSHHLAAQSFPAGLHSANAADGSRWWKRSQELSYSPTSLPRCRNMLQGVICTTGFRCHWSRSCSFSPLMNSTRPAEKARNRTTHETPWIV